MLSTSLVILSEALDRMVQGEAKNLRSSLRVNSAKPLGSLSAAGQKEQLQGFFARQKAAGSE